MIAASPISIITRILLIGIRLYRYAISPLMAPHCRYYPSCSDYAQQALHDYGAWRGGLLAMKRLLRCHPWSSGGVDLVPSPDRSHPDPSHKPIPTPAQSANCCAGTDFKTIQHGGVTASDCHGFVQDQGEKAQCTCLQVSIFNTELGQIRGEMNSYKQLFSRRIHPWLV